MAQLTPGAQALAVLIQDPAMFDLLCKQIRCSRNSLRVWARGEGVPKLAASLILERHGIPLSHWGVLDARGRAV